MSLSKKVTPLEAAHRVYERFGQNGALTCRRLSDAHLLATIEAYNAARAEARILVPARGCICPPGAEIGCQRWDCGRKSACPTITTYGTGG